LIPILDVSPDPIERDPRPPISQHFTPARHAIDGPTMDRYARLPPLRARDPPPAWQYPHPLGHLRPQVVPATLGVQT
jgi:hypothetical protein